MSMLTTSTQVFVTFTRFTPLRGSLVCVWPCLRPPRCVSTGPVVVRLAEMANERERERVSGREGPETERKLRGSA